MKQIRPILCLFLAMLVLVSSTTFMIGFHRCNGEVRKISLFTHAEGCQHQQKLPPCHRVKHKPCCESDQVVHQSEDFNHSTKISHISIEGGLDIVLPTDVVISVVVPSSTLPDNLFYEHQLPIPVSDLSLVNRVLLI